MPPITPTVGRIVLCFCPSRWQGPRPGIILRCWGDNPSSAVNVQVFPDGGSDAEGSNHWTSMLVSAPGEREVAGHDGERWCEWMTYQMGQAAKAEAAETKLAEAGQKPATAPKS